jgi:hypothetical protein
MMTKITKSLIAILAGLTTLSVLGGCSTPNLALGSASFSADYFVYDTLDDAVKASTDIVEAQFISSRSDMEYPDTSSSSDPAKNPQAGVELTEEEKEALGVPITISTLKVTSVLEGDLSVGDVIEVSQLGGIKDGVQYTETDTTLMGDVPSSDGSLLLFINDHGGKSMSLISQTQGLMTVSGDTVKAVHGKGNKHDKQLAKSLKEIKKSIAQHGNKK